MDAKMRRLPKRFFTVVALMWLLSGMSEFVGMKSGSLCEPFSALLALIRLFAGMCLLVCSQFRARYEFSFPNEALIGLLSSMNAHVIK